jgi:hypothetical protein
LSKWLLNGLVVVTVVACLNLVGCGKKGHCAKCENDSECASDECAVFSSDSGDMSLRCGNGSSTGRDTCNVRE